MTNLDNHYSTRNYIAYALGFAIRRLPAPKRTTAEKRVAALVANKPQDYTRDFLSYLIGGRKALEDSKRKLGLYCVHFCDDVGLIRELLEPDRPTSVPSTLPSGTRRSPTTRSILGGRRARRNTPESEKGAAATH